MGLVPNTETNEMFLGVTDSYVIKHKDLNGL